MKRMCGFKNKNNSGNILLQTLFSCLAAFGLISAGLAVSYYYDNNNQPKTNLVNYLKTNLTPENPLPPSLKLRRTPFGKGEIDKDSQPNNSFTILKEEDLIYDDSQVLGIQTTKTIQAKQNQGIYQLSIQNKSINSKDIGSEEINSRTIENRSIESKDISSRLTIHTLRIGNSSDRPPIDLLIST